MPFTLLHAEADCNHQLKHDILLILCSKPLLTIEVAEENHLSLIYTEMPRTQVTHV